MAKAKKAAPKKPVTERINTLLDVLADQGYTQESFDKWCEGLDLDEVGYRHAKLIARALNEGKEMKTADTDQWKYFPYFRVVPDASKKAGFGLSCHDYADSRTGAAIGARLGFKDPSLARHAGETFPEVYERFFS